jgi:ubiquinone/menaquinone biosynthesis C-methylase UbiE
MMIDTDNLICCPLCKGDLKTNTQKGQQWSSKDGSVFYHCAECNQQYPLVGSIVDFLPPNPKKKSLTQQMMESKPFVHRYEGKSWRESQLFTAYAGISFKKEMELIKEIAHLNDDDTVLDLACGTGLYTRNLAKESAKRKIVGLDISWPMLRYAAEKVAAQKIKNVVLFRGDAHHLPLRASSVHAAICCGSLHLFDDARQVLKELFRVIKSNGHLALAVFLTGSNLLGKIDAYWKEVMWGIHPFCEAELKELLSEASFKPTVFHAWGVWMIASGIKRPIMGSSQNRATPP